MVAVAVIFDLDGVLADSEPVHLAAEQAARAEHGHELTKAAKQRFVGLANAEIMHGLIETFGIDSTVDELAAAKAGSQRALLADMGGFPATTELVHRLGRDIHTDSRRVRINALEHRCVAGGRWPRGVLRHSGQF